MSESKDAKKIKTIAFRLTDEEYARAESAAIAAGDETPSSWCRTLVLQQATSGTNDRRTSDDQENPSPISFRNSLYKSGVDFGFLVLDLRFVLPSIA